MKLPIYQSEQHTLPELSQANHGLRFERFFDGYNLHNSNEIKPKDEAKKDFLNKFANSSCGDKETLEAAACRQVSLCQATGGDFQVFKLDGHFVTGMGNSHPVENGFLWHYTLGVPYLSGSQVKGLVRSLIEQYHPKENREKILFQWFGSEDKNCNQASQDSQAGELIFFDAIPIKPPYLSVDIMTPHMKDWYAKGGEISDTTKDSDKIPADWHDPVPVPFLACKDASFIFSIGKRLNSSIQIDDVLDCLQKALDIMGIGGKTQTGYGYMSENETEKTRLQKIIEEEITKQKNLAEEKRKEQEFSQSLQGKSALEQEFLNQKKNNDWHISGKFITPKANQEQSDAETWLAKLSDNPEPAVLELFKQQMEELYKGIYADPDKKQGKKQKPVFKEKPIDIIKRLKALIDK